MAENDDFDVDPAIAARMGFSSFGMQGKKRKHTADDAFVDPSASLTLNPRQEDASKSSENNISKTLSSNEPSKDITGREAVASRAPRAGEPASGYVAPSGYVSKYSLEELRRGVKNENGDMVYFQPSFIQDPWAKYDKIVKTSK